MVRSDYTYSIEDDTLKIIDLNLGNMSVTNNIEEVLTEILHNEGNYIQDLKVIYRDSECIWDTVIPEWNGCECVFVRFISGIN